MVFEWFMNGVWMVIWMVYEWFINGLLMVYEWLYELFKMLGLGLLDRELNSL
jgi:hypothetical protein